MRPTAFKYIALLASFIAGLAQAQERCFKDEVVLARKSGKVSSLLVRELREDHGARIKLLDVSPHSIRAKLVQSKADRGDEVSTCSTRNPCSVLRSWAKAKGSRAFVRAASRLCSQNNELQLEATPNDPYFASYMYGLSKISAPQAWDISTGSSDVVIGVIDTGIDYNHPDLSANMWINSGEVAGNGIDDDGNGYIDDVYGMNGVANNGNPMDDHYHGTHCAGTIGGVGNNGVGVTGVAWNVKLMGLKFLNNRGSGSTSDAVETLNYVIAMKNRGVNIRATNNSWGGGGYSAVLYDAIRRSTEAGVIFVAAAGNSNLDNDGRAHYPSSYDLAGILAVASTDSSDNRSSFSNYGATTVDLGAPGSSILSTYTTNRYAYLSGTSMATPHVAGAVAVLLGANPNLTVAQIKQILMDTVDPLSALSGKTVTGGRMNVYVAVMQAAALAPTPTPSPSMTPTPAPSSTPTPESTPSSSPTASPSATPTASPSATPSATPTPQPTASASPSPTPTVEPSPTPLPRSVQRACKRNARGKLINPKACRLALRALARER